MIQWFPGHMAKAIKQIKENESLADIFIVVLDARAPISSYNEEFDKIAPKKPRLFIITKLDLGDSSKINKISLKFNNDIDSVVAVDLKSNKSKKIILDSANKLLINKKQNDLKNGIIKPRLRAFVIGVPNSGKSTLINLLSNSSKAKTGNMPGITRGKQWINSEEIQLLDTPGILWPKFQDELVGIKLAIIGSIKINIIPKQEIFYSGYKLLTKYYPNKIIEIGLKPSFDENEIYSNLNILCENKKFFLSKDKLNLEKGIEWFIFYLRNLKGITYDDI